jgi:DNA-binding NarL/FixJ family response regulator
MRASMKPLSVVVLQNSSKSAESLAKSLYPHFRVVNVARDLVELKNCIPRHRADVAIVDLELAGLDEVQRLKHDFSATNIVCTHRLADEKMWSKALAAGAIDCCASSDVRSIVLAASQMAQMFHSHAA